MNGRAAMRRTGAGQSIDLLCGSTAEEARVFTFPKLMISGDWEGAPEQYRKYAGEPLIACAGHIAEAIGAEHLVVPGYYPHTQQPKRVNAALQKLWNGTAPP